MYFIQDKNGDKIKFNLNNFQQVLFNGLWYFNIILKSRQLGVTTFFCIFYLDEVLFNKNKTAAIIAHTEKDAKKIFKKVQFAFNNLPNFLRNELAIEKDSAEELTFKNGSSINVSVSTRSSTVQYLHISEFGWTCLKYPDKAEEIVTGAINSVEQGCFVSIESTAHTREGYFFKFCEDARRSSLSGRNLSKLEFKFFFFPWFMNPEYKLMETLAIPQRLTDYFNELEVKDKIVLTDDQRKWYVAKEKIEDDKMFQEFPSTADEAFQASTEGAYYKKQILKAIQEKRIRTVPYDPAVPVDTWWDLGMNDLNVILFTQDCGSEIHFIDCYSSSGEGLQHYVKVLQNKEYIYRMHHFPHDIKVRELGSGKSRLTSIQGMGLRMTDPPNDDAHVTVLGVEDGVELTRQLFNRFYFDEQKCEPLINAIINYRKDWDERIGQFRSQPVHDINSHFADALRLLGVNHQNTYKILYQEEEKEERYAVFPNVT